MKRLLLYVPVLAMSLQASADRYEYHDCLLHYLQGAKLDEVTRLIKRACTENYLGPAKAQRQARATNECLLQYLTGVESREAVAQIQISCREKQQ